MNFFTRMAETGDFDRVTQVFSPSHRLLTFLPDLHTVDEDCWFITNIIARECEVIVAEAEAEIVAFLALDGNEIRLLHTHPDHIGLGAGTHLIQCAKTRPVDHLELWCFQENKRARRFYERQGFHAVEFTDGMRNEEKTPDVRYRWNRKSL